jgi:hypothetical protein
VVIFVLILKDFRTAMAYKEPKTRDAPFKMGWRLSGKV